MLKYISKRIIYLIPVLIGIVFLVFTIMYFSPGDPAKLILGDRAPEEQVAALRHELGLDLPYYQQLFNYIKNAIHGDFGNSYQLRMPVWDIIKLRFPLTLQLTTFTMLIAVLIGVPVGILSAVKQYSVIDAFSVIFALLMASIPAFWLGMLLMLLFSLNLGWLPSSGYEGVKWLILPSITLGFINCATIMRMTRSSMLEVVRQDFIRTARAKGATEKRVVFRHALKNAIIPVITVVGTAFGSSLGGAVVTETVFGLPGMGTQIITAIRQKDNPVVLASVIVIALAFSLVNLIVDILYTYVDPRIRD
ncbi:MAG: ABC transporter permease [Christensenellales bacterium]|nr:ABC transporter permease [Eubacteriales bacterium]